MNILIIEDDQSVAELERDYLEINGGFHCDLPYILHIYQLCLKSFFFQAKQYHQNQLMYYKLMYLFF